MAKMYLSEQEAAQKVGGTAQLTRLVSDGKLRVYSDGPRKMYKTAEVDAVATKAGLEGSGEIELTPADTSSKGDAISLSDSTARPKSKDDSVISTEGISIFDEEDLEIEAADPMAKTTIAPSVEEQLSAEGVGSGSGLLDLTREPDDTSLGAVLEDISVESAVGSSAVTVAEEQGLTEVAPAIEAPPVVEAIDATAGAFGGLALAGLLVALLLAVVAVPLIFVQDYLPKFIDAMSASLPLLVAAAAVLTIILAVAGLFIGKSAAARAAALQRR